MGGELHLRSEPDQGSVFWFELDLPVNEGSLAFAPGKALLPIGFEGRARRILIVDDKPENRSVLANLLTPLGFEISEAEDGQVALELAAANRPDLILMDLVMSVLDGFEATRRLRQTPGLSDIPVIALSASAFDHTRQQSIDVGCNDFIPKPVRHDVLLEKLKEHLDLDWRYADDAAAPVLPPVAPRNAGEVSAPLTPDEAEVLFDIAMQGDIHALLEHLDNHENLKDPGHPFGLRLRELARSYQMEQIRKLIKPHLEHNK
jgi:CheY-like chemotaxis protein